jgi:hypothetical protein
VGFIDSEEVVFTTPSLVMGGGAVVRTFRYNIPPMYTSIQQCLYVVIHPQSLGEAHNEVLCSSVAIVFICNAQVIDVNSRQPLVASPQVLFFRTANVNFRTQYTPYIELLQTSTNRDLILGDFLWNK